jgi:murein DD-endopeptidase MepM/ murein hydrolase activator NlpD
VLKRRGRLAVPMLVAAVPFGTIALASMVTLVTPQCSLAGTGPISAGGWITTGATLDPTYTGGAYQHYYNNGLSYAELGATPGYPNYDGGLLAHALGLPGGQYGLPPGFPLLVRPVGSGSDGIRILKSDIGSGQAGDPHYTIDLHPRIAQLLNFNGKEDIQVKAAGNDPGASPSSLAGDCTSAAGTYTNPFAHTQNLVAQRIDMGVDYDGQGGIDALGNATVTFAGTGIGGGWTCDTSENGGVVYQLTDGPGHGHYVYVTEDVIPTVSRGQQVAAGQQIATFAPAGGTGCIEIGFASGPDPSPQAAALGQQATVGDAGANRTYCGEQMSNLLVATGAPAGLTEGRPIVGSSC